VNVNNEDIQAIVENIEEEERIVEKPKELSPKFESDETDKISAALSAAQGEFEELSANSKSYVGNYAGFFDIVKSVRPSLTKNKLSVTQQVKWVNGMMIFSTTLRHSSGQWIESQIPILQKFIPIGDKAKHPLQSFGAALTYLERYSFRRLLNIADDKDS